MNFFSIDSGFYHFLEKITNFFLLNLLWILLCLPIITIFPATAAMYGVVRQWVRNNETSVFRSFFTLFKENFLQSFLVGILWFLLIFMFYFNFNVTMQMTGLAKTVMISALLLIFLFFVMTSIYLFPVMVHYKVRFIGLIKNSFLFSISQLGITLLCTMILVITALVSYIVPISTIIVWSLAVYLIYRLCNRTFTKVDDVVQLD